MKAWLRTTLALAVLACDQPLAETPDGGGTPAPVDATSAHEAEPVDQAGAHDQGVPAHDVGSVTGWSPAPATWTELASCAAPKLEAGVTLLNASSVLTDVGGLGDRFVITWMDREGVTTAKVGTLSLEGRSLAVQNLGSPGLEPRLAVGGAQVAVSHLSAADPGRRDFPFAVFSPTLARTGGVPTISRSAGVNAAQTALAWGGNAFGLLTGSSSLQLLVLRPDGTEALFAVGPQTTLRGRSFAGLPDGFALVTTTQTGAYLATLAAADGSEQRRLALPADAAAIAIARDPSSGMPMAALAGAQVQLLESSGALTPISSLVGSIAPRVDLVVLGQPGGVRTAVVAWTGTGLAGVLYHVTGVNSVDMPYFKTSPTTSAPAGLWLVAAGDSIGIFVASIGGDATYLRLRCQ